jgi:hypothetical protein
MVATDSVNPTPPRGAELLFSRPLFSRESSARVLPKIVVNPGTSQSCGPGALLHSLGLFLSYKKGLVAVSTCSGLERNEGDTLRPGSIDWYIESVCSS